MSLVAENLVKNFGALAATQNVNLRVEGSGVHALIGPNGAGKTTLVNLLSGALTPSSGRVLLDGQDVSRVDMPGRVARGLSRTYQITSIYPDWTVERNIALSVQGRSGSSFRFWQPVAHERNLYRQAADIAEEVGLTSRLHQPASALSHGERKQLDVALALASQPRFLLMDEPMAGLGHEESGQMVQLIRRIAATRSVLLIEHDMDAVFSLARDVSVLVYGQIIASGTPDAIKNDPEVQKAYLGDDHAA
ncbi:MULTISPECIES: ABC transporter ATP-binding protein [Deinococcus]|uniref:ABC transporter ATP-binding protein n=1 Tax=Deinococcus cavernae TaxID=2320857 RepID=A0A418UZZ3_9DEIO|nr:MULTISPECIES: ABC transporter ATP-binding protein [Deinococcus]RJF69020.1 ABC transporter ATP-binding protein [Deinococcus cavernae]